MENVKQQQAKWKTPFFTIWTGQQLSLVGSSVAQFALIWWLTKSTGSATVLAMASLVGLLPGIVLGPFIGALVDRWNRRLVMIAADSLIALASLWLAYLFWVDTPQIWQIYVILFVRAVGGGFHYPAMESSTSLMVPNEHLTRVAGLNQTIKGVLNIISAPLGALLMELMPFYSIMLLDVGTAALAIVPLFFVFIPQPEQTEKKEAAQKRTLLSDVQEGLHYIWNWKGLMMLIGLALILKIALTPALSLIPLLVSDYFRGDAGQLALLEVVAGVGIIAGGVTLSAWGGFRRRIYTMMVGITVGGLSFILIGLVPPTAFVIALICFFVFAAMIPLVDGPIMAILQSTVAPEKQGRVFTIMGSLLNLTGPISLAVAGPLSDWMGLQMWYLAAGVLCIGTGVVGYLTPAMVNIEENCNGDKVKTEAMVTVPEAT